MATLQQKSDRLRGLLSVLPLEESVRTILLNALNSDLSEETLQEVAQAAKDQLQSLKNMADLLDVQNEVSLSQLEAQAIELTEDME